MKHPVNFRLSEEAITILGEEAERHGLSKTSALELILRQYSEESKIHNNARPIQKPRATKRANFR